MTNKENRIESCYYKEFAGGTIEGELEAGGVPAF